MTDTLQQWAPDPSEDPDKDFTGFGGPVPQYMTAMCPCGAVMSVLLRDLPRTDTPMPCGKPNHWFTKYVTPA